MLTLLVNEDKPLAGLYATTSPTISGIGFVPPISDADQGQSVSVKTFARVSGVVADSFVTGDVLHIGIGDGINPPVCYVALSSASPAVGTLPINTDGMVALFAATVANQIGLNVAIARTRAGETNTIFSAPIVIHRSVINPLTAVPTPSILGTGVAAALLVPVNTALGFVRTDSLNKLPALDGSQLLNLPSGASTFAALTDKATADIPAINTPIANALTGKQAAFTAQVQKTFFAGPTSGSDAAPAFRTIAAADVPTLNQNTTGSAGSVLLQNIGGMNATVIDAAAVPTNNEGGLVTFSGNIGDATAGDLGVTGNLSVAILITAGLAISINGANGVISATEFVGPLTGDVTGNASGSAGTVTSIGNLTGDVTSVNRATTLATVNSNVGSFTNANVTVNAKGLVTAASSGTAFDPASPGAIGGTTASTIAMTSGTFTLSFKSTTALATPSALSATQFTAFASTVSGATLMGYGTTGDVTLKNRAGVDALIVVPNTTGVQFPGATFHTGNINLGPTAGYAYITGNTGSIFLTANNGKTLYFGGSSLAPYGASPISLGEAIDGFCWSDAFLAQTASVKWQNGGTVNCTLSRNADGVLQIGTTAANALGSLLLTNLTASGVITFGEGANIVAGTSTGTKIGTGTTQKIGFWNATPVVQPTAVADASGGAIIDAEARTALNALLARLRTLGIIAT